MLLVLGIAPYKGSLVWSLPGYPVQHVIAEVEVVGIAYLDIHKGAVLVDGLLNVILIYAHLFSVYFLPNDLKRS